MLVSLSVLLHRNPIGELGATLGVDIQTARFAEGHKFVGYQYGPYHDAALRLVGFLGLLGGQVPFGPSGVQISASSMMVLMMGKSSSLNQAMAAARIGWPAPMGVFCFMGAPMQSEVVRSRFLHGAAPTIFTNMAIGQEGQGVSHAE